MPLIISSILSLAIVYYSTYINSRYIRYIIQDGSKIGIVNNIWVIHNKKYIKDRLKRSYRFILSKSLGNGAIVINFTIMLIISLIGRWGIGIGIIYSIILFLVVKKYIKDIRITFNKLQQVTLELVKKKFSGRDRSKLRYI